MQSKVKTKCGTYAGFKYHRNHGEEICDACRIACNERSRQYRIDNPDKEKAAKRKWNSKNSIKIAEMSRRRRARVYNNGFLRYTEEEVLNTYGSDCYVCNKKIDLKAQRRVGLKGWQNGLHIDHLIPISKGGSDIIENVRPTHALCNIKKGNK